MLRNRSKQALMADQNSLLSPKKPISSFLNSPRIFNGLLTKSHSEPEITQISPTSILDTKSSTNFVNPFGYDQNLPKIATPSHETNSPCDKFEPKAIGLALIDSLNDEKSDSNFSKPINRMVLLGSKLKVQIPTINGSSSISPVESPNSQADFGIKTKNSQILSPFSETPSKYFTRQLSLKEMELSEEYTCVITHGPNPKTTHIFDNCIVECCCGEEMKNCKDGLDQGKDIFM